eukprot:Rmarinus@m.13152
MGQDRNSRAEHYVSRTPVRLKNQSVQFCTPQIRAHSHSHSHSTSSTPSRKPLPQFPTKRRLLDENRLRRNNAELHGIVYICNDSPETISMEDATHRPVSMTRVASRGYTFSELNVLDTTWDTLASQSTCTTSAEGATTAGSLANVYFPPRPSSDPASLRPCFPSQLPSRGTTRTPSPLLPSLCALEPEAVRACDSAIERTTLCTTIELSKNANADKSDLSASKEINQAVKETNKRVVTDSVQQQFETPGTETIQLPAGAAEETSGTEDGKVKVLGGRPSFSVRRREPQKKLSIQIDLETFSAAKTGSHRKLGALTRRVTDGVLYALSGSERERERGETAQSEERSSRLENGKKKGLMSSTRGRKSDDSSHVSTSHGPLVHNDSREGDFLEPWTDEEGMYGDNARANLGSTVTSLRDSRGGSDWAAASVAECQTAGAADDSAQEEDLSARAKKVLEIPPDEYYMTSGRSSRSGYGVTKEREREKGSSRVLRRGKSEGFRIRIPSDVSSRPSKTSSPHCVTPSKLLTPYKKKSKVKSTTRSLSCLLPASASSHPNSRSSLSHLPGYFRDASVAPLYGEDRVQVGVGRKGDVEEAGNEE